ncbi:MAG: flagellar FlbD family protein [Archangium sp.]|nr:flagellar FlbD family protein [Archangium sp.]
MILLTKLDGHTIAVNDELIVFAESTPDTVITMSGGQRMLIREPLAELMERVRAFRRSTFPGGEHG